MKSRYQVSFTTARGKGPGRHVRLHRSTQHSGTRYSVHWPHPKTLHQLEIVSATRISARRHPGLRVIGFERRVSIAFRVAPGQVTIARILYGGRHLEGELRDSES